MSKKSSLTSEVVTSIKSSRLFDAEWYLQRYPEVQSLGLDPAEHYAKLGFLLKKDPSPSFSTQAYLKDNPDVAEAKVNPLFHFIKWGEAEGRWIRPSSLVATRELATDRPATGRKSSKIVTSGETSLMAQGSAKHPLERDEVSPASIGTTAQGSGDIVRHTGVHDDILFSVDELEKRLWGGYSLHAAPRLEKIKHDRLARLGDRVDAAWYLARWYMFMQDPQKAYDNAVFLRFCRQSPDEWKRSSTTTGTVQQVTSLSGMSFENAMLATYLLEIQCLTKLQRFPEALRIVAEGRSKVGDLPDFHLMHANLQRLSALARGEPVQHVDSVQLAALNHIFDDVNLAPLRLKDPSLPLHFSNLTADATPVITVQSEKVTIIIPAFNAENTLHVPLTSLIDQTWRNLEIIVVDDHSTDGTRDIVESYAKVDPRIRLIAKSINEGAYPARNAGLKAATGDLIMVHDSDDWSHPQKIEHQIAHMRSKKDCVAVMSHWVRFDEWLIALGRWRPVGSLFDLNFSSLLFRRVVLERLKGWDNVRVSGDAEFRFRIQEVFGLNAIRNVPKRFLLSLSLSREDSLTQSKSTHLRSLEFGLRWQYRDAYQYWYSSATRRDSLAMQENSNQFPIPLGNKSKRKVSDHFDIVLVADFATHSESMAHAMSYLRAGHRNGLRVAAVHWRRFEYDPHSPLQAEFYACCMETHAEILTPGDEVTTYLLLVTQPSVLQYKQDSFPTISPNRAAVLALENGNLIHTTTRQYDPLVAQSHLYSLTSVPAKWMPSSETVRAHLSEDRQYYSELGNVWMPLVEGFTHKDWKQNRQRRDTPVIGRSGDDIAEAWPASKSDFDSVFGAGKWKVKLLGSANALLKRVGRLPDYCQVVSRAGDLEAEFFSSIDFFVYFPSLPGAATGDYSIAQALAHGVVVVLPLEYACAYGEAAIYAAAGDIPRAIQSLWQCEIEYSNQALKGLTFAQENFSYERLTARLEALTEEPLSANLHAKTV